MAPVITTSQTPVPVPVPPTKSKRPIPPGIQTNGVSSLKSSPSPNMSAKRPPPARQPSIPPTPNGVTPSSNRPPHRRRDTSNQMMGRGQRSAGLRSASLVPPDSAVPWVPEPVPYVVTDKHILNKFAGNPPSLIVHMHPTHFRFDQQEGMFQYKSPMRLFLEHLRTRTVPHDMMEYFVQWGVTFYDGCLIVQVHDHKSVAQAKEVQRPSSASSKTIPFSIHNYTPYLTPSPFVPFPKENQITNGDNSESSGADAKEKTAEEKDKENMPAPSIPEGSRGKNGSKAKVITIVLHPTPQSLHSDLMIKAATPRGSGDGRADGAPPPTPHTLVPPTPTASNMPPPAKRQKREKMELDGSNIYVAESQILLATTAKLDLEPTKNHEETIKKMERLAHPDHSHDPPQPKTRKRTVAEMAADEALAAEQERYMLTLDERLSSKVSNAQGANGPDGEGQAGGAAFEPRFERFKVIEDIKREHAEKKEQEKQKQAENERRLLLQKQQQAQQQAEQHAAQQAQLQQQRTAALAAQQQQAQAQAAHAQAQAEEQQKRERLREQSIREQQQRQEAHSRAMHQAQIQARANQVAAAQQIAATMGQAPHAHPAHSPLQAGMQTPNGIATSMAGQPGARFHQVSAPPVSSPIVRQNTPLSVSSPMVPNVPMQHSNSSMGQSPQRPGSAVQSHGPMSIPMTASMSARGSQQSHAAGTPRMPSATPNMGHATPINRPQVINTPRMSQASPPPGMITAQQQLGNAMLMNQNIAMQNGMTNAAALAAQQRMIQQQQQQMNMMQHPQGGGMVGGNQQMTPQQQQMMHQRVMQQQLLNMQRHQQANGQPNNPQAHAQRQAMINQYAAQLAAMNGNASQLNPMQRQIAAQQAAAAAAAAQGQGMMGMNGMNGMNPAQMQQLQQMQQFQQQQQQAQQQQAQHQQQLQQQQQQQAQHQQQQHMGGGVPVSQQLTEQIRRHAQALFNTRLNLLAERYGGAQNIPPDVMADNRMKCQNQAKQMVQQAIMQGRINPQAMGLTPQQQQALLMQQQQQAQAQAAAMQGMMPQGMSMP